jgi:acetyl-CoA carboxylase biotin carboxyl carrier protein
MQKDSKDGNGGNDRGEPGSDNPINHYRPEPKIEKSINHYIGPSVMDKIIKDDKVTEQVKAEKVEEKLLAIESPIIGTFYRAPSPDAPPFIKEGDIVNNNTIVCLIAAMGISNQITAKVEGKIVKVLVENEESVAVDQKLFLVEPIKKL